MKKIGILFGREDSFQWALIDRINQKQVADVVAEPVKTGHVTMGKGTGYSLIYDRISHDIPFYKVFLKNEVLSGTQVINDPFWSLADDKFFDCVMGERLGVAMPKTVLIPHRDHPPDTSSMSMRNLVYPLDWEGIFEHLGFPLYLKQHYGGGWKHVHKIGSPEELFHVYGQTGHHLMMLQENIEYDSYFRCYCIGREQVLVMPYEPRNDHARRYQANHASLTEALHERIVRDALTLNRGLGYDMNTAEFAVRDGVPIAIDFMNWAPDCDRHSVGEENFEWVVEHVSSMLIDRTLHPEKARTHKTWQQSLL
jgi:glutathione synthase/RimK-type ligase-like ATP-grasp enzyme